MIALGLSMPPAEAEEGAGLESCVRIALANNADFFVAQKDADLNRARARIATLQLFPAAALKAEETRGRADELNGTPSFVERLYGVQATQTLFQGGHRWATQRQARTKADIGSLEVARQRNLLIFQVEEAYWRLSALENAKAAYRETSLALQDSLEKAARHELSDSPRARIEILSTRAQNRECEVALAETEEAILQARSRLLDLLGQNLPSFPADPLPDVKKLSAEEDECLRLGRAHRPEPALAEKEARAAEWGRLAGRSALYPKVDLHGFYGRSGAAYDQSEPFHYQRDWNAGVRASWVFLGNTGGYSSSKEKTSPKLGESSRTETQTQALRLSFADAFGPSLDNAEAQKAHWLGQRRLEKTRRHTDEDIRLTCRKLENAWKKTQSAQARLEQAQQEFTDTRYLLQEDKAHLGDIAAAVNRVGSARADLSEARANYRIAVADLNRAIGIPGHFKTEGDLKE